MTENPTQTGFKNIFSGGEGVLFFVLAAVGELAGHWV